ncbi:MAG TPA: acetate kinase [Dissulfurispiraceae bacterium]|nr:acetate kinase [Dissulfurispiraceae bacterium]
MKVLVLNAGSSSIKYQIFNMENSLVLTSGLMEQIGEQTSRLKYKWIANGSGEPREAAQEGRIADHGEGLKLILDITMQLGVLHDLNELSGIGHRVVHGGEAFWKPTLITGKVLDVVRDMIPLAPLHNPANLMGIEVSRTLCPSVPQVAVFDTAFHQTMPPVAYHYAIPYRFYKELKVRRYGFHGTSHRFVAKQCAHYLRKPLMACNLITIHIGNGGSMSAIREGQCVDTTMGMTPLEGLVMGTRSGDIDPAIPFYLARTLNLKFDEVENILNKQSGLKGICGVNDMREIERMAAGGNFNAKLAIDMFCYRIRKYIGSYYAVLGTVDSIIFTGGIGENAVETRLQICSGLEALGIVMDAGKNAARVRDMREISADNSPVKVMVIPTNEELEIARQTVECLKGS